ncbi:MAG: hypothetical protein OXU20_12725 [Myxococcales bacterium]|nr:hypothetical protein [Myxococcales bacterium]MDD9971986.1 hypothetical protein [Myxococcales bacterium]
MTEHAPDPLADDAFLEALLDTLIPPEGPMPGAGSLGLSEDIRTGVVANTVLAAPVSAALSALRTRALEREPGGFSALTQDAREQLLSSLMDEQPALGIFQLFVFAGYYHNAKVLQALGLPGVPPFPRGHTIEETDPALLSKLASRRR